jgi:hypothetical protein
LLAGPTLRNFASQSGLGLKLGCQEFEVDEGVLGSSTNEVRGIETGELLFEGELSTDRQHSKRPWKTDLNREWTRMNANERESMEGEMDFLALSERP